MRVVRKGEGALYVPPGHDDTVSAIKLHDPSTGCAGADVHITTFAPGAGMAEEVHPHSDHVFYVLSGNLEVSTGDVLVGTLQAGDSIHIPAGERHQVSNPADHDGVFLAVTFPLA